MIDILLPSLLVGLMLAAISGPLGCFVVWGRMSYFGDTLAHASLMGMTIGLLLSIKPLFGVLITTLAVALVLAFSQRQNKLANDTILGIIAHGTLATGLVIASQLNGIRVDLMAFLFGDLLAVNYQDVIWVAGICVVLAVLLWRCWAGLLNTLVSSEIARAEGVSIHRMRTVLLVMLALLVAIGMKVVGALLITAMLIIPAASARRLAQTPEQMAVLASVTGLLAVMAGLVTSFLWDTPTGPSIVLCACLLFAASHLKPVGKS
ncbi:MAG: zinc ABC transporter permease subunit ZnuB [Ketobacteraceae bacterium]|nr:zinc ABC transporter permease subunit ZnuB [Ketobacteraceae bacterium]